MTKKVMKLIDPYTGLMECKVCGQRHLSSIKPGGGYYRGSWQCTNGCRLEEIEPVLDEEFFERSREYFKKAFEMIKRGNRI
ncbi:hypothetical protein A7K50_12370 [Dehalobacter sp. MCB1]|uniref:hypothetical protein n=1 Tax=Dehalobacter sp. MCB1 TaxID=1844756 RepID=UPI000E6D25F0|nr:hypothetical protein [Dehalobacter sp. MCB1]RJE46813.1 hypothetical protein A7K50_12370 [Dehalobacter sp. MCB1]